MNPDEARMILTNLLTLHKPLGELQRDVATLPWDAPEPLVLLKRAHVLAVLRKYVEGKCSASEVELWANLLESREDIDFEQRYEEVLNQVIFELANPTMEGAIEPAMATRWIEQLSS